MTLPIECHQLNNENDSSIASNYFFNLKDINENKEDKLNYTFLKDGIYQFIFRSDPNLPDTATATCIPIPIYTLSFDMINELLEEKNVYQNINFIQYRNLDTLEEKSLNALEENSLDLDEEDSSVFIKELKELQYSEKTIEFYKKSSKTYEKIEKGEFTIDL